MDDVALLERLKDFTISADPLAARVRRLLAAIDYVRVSDRRELEQVRQLRYRAYVAAGVAGARADASLADDYDLAPNAANFALRFDGQFCASIRLHGVMHWGDPSPACEIFPDLLQPQLACGYRLIDPNCFCVDPVLSGKVPELAYLILRLPHMAAEAAPRSMVTATVRPDHMAFYRRMLRARLAAEPRLYPGRLKPLGLMLVDFDSERDAIAARNPFFLGRPGEADMLGLSRHDLWPAMPARVAA